MNILKRIFPFLRNNPNDTNHDDSDSLGPKRTLEDIRNNPNDTNHDDGDGAVPKRTLEDIWKEERSNKTLYYEADGRYVKEVYDENGRPLGNYTFMPDTKEWVLGTPSFYWNERVQISEARCLAMVDND